MEICYIGHSSVLQIQLECGGVSRNGVLKCRLSNATGNSQECSGTVGSKPIDQSNLSR